MDDPPNAETVHGLATRKNDLVIELLRRDGVDVYDGSVRFVEVARERGLRRAVVSASSNCREVLEVAGIAGLFEVVVDGVVAAERELRGSPRRTCSLQLHTCSIWRPSTRRCSRTRLPGSRRAAQVRFRWVVGVDRGSNADALRVHGADIVVDRPRRAAGGGALIDRGVFTIDPWAVVEPRLRLDLLAQTESIFALSNGHIGLRGNLDEGEPHAIPGTYLNGFFESLPLPYAEAGYGYPEQGQSIVNATNGKLVRLLVDDEPFDVRYGTLTRHERVLDLRAGVLRRTVEWTSPAGQAVCVRSTRLVSFVQRSIAAVLYEVEAVGTSARVVVQSGLVANEPAPDRTDEDPRAAAALRAPLVGEYHSTHDLEAALGHHTRLSGLRMAAALDHVVDGPAGTVTDAECEPDLARVTVSTELMPGQVLRVTKFAAYGWSGERSMPALRDQVDAALSAAKRTGWDGLVAAQREYLDDVWSRADVEVDGDPELQQAVRFALFQLVQAAARAERRGIAAKGLTGPGYDGHTFWDTETYAMRVLSYTAPAAAERSVVVAPLDPAPGPCTSPRARVGGCRLPVEDDPRGGVLGVLAGWHGCVPHQRRRRRRRPAVRPRHRRRRLRGRSWPALLVETARLWRSLGHHDAAGCFRIDGVTGPDEYSALVDNNVFTNLMAARNLARGRGGGRALPAGRS